MKFTKRSHDDNQRLAERIFATLGHQIADACVDTEIPCSFVAGQISVENSLLDPQRSRFESGVFESLRKVRDGHSANFGNITQEDIEDCDDRVLVNLATSWGYCQIMGFHSINTLRCTVGDLRNSEKHLPLNIAMLQVVAGRRHRPNYFASKSYEFIYRIWNTGRSNGKTYDPYYCANAMAVMDIYSKI